MKVEILASKTGAVPTPIEFLLTAEQSSAIDDGPLQLVPTNCGLPELAQKTGEKIVALLRHSAAGTTTYDIQATPHLSGVRLSAGESTLSIGLPEGEFGVYHFEEHAPRPYFWPLFGPGGKRVTRSFPMEVVDHETPDHKHHRSLWTAFDEVNGTNNWHEEEPHGFTRHQKFTDFEQGVVRGGFRAQNFWTTADDKPLMSETRSLQLYNCGNEFRLFDYAISWSADFGHIHFGDTKEAGVLSLRVASAMDGTRGGVIENANGGRGEAQCWGKKAAWCDYSGQIDNEIFGIAVFDHPNNPDFPTRWHVRDYGLFATNPFSTAAFDDGDATPFELASGESVTFRYRVLLHRGRASEANVNAFSQGFAEPPTARII